MALNNSYASRLEGLFYSKSDEKFTLRTMLDQIYGEQHFGKALDVGPGPGYISEPLARRCREIVMVELLDKYKDILEQQFPNARVIIGSIADYRSDTKYDTILFSHNLYYHPETDWLPLTQRLFEHLNPGGELIIILNADTGDWWKIIHTFWDRLREHISFNYIPLTTFKKDLGAIAPIKVHPYKYQLWMEPGAPWTKFLGKTILEIDDDSVLAKFESEFLEMEKAFRRMDESLVLDFRGEIIRLKKDGTTQK